MKDFLRTRLVWFTLVIWVVYAGVTMTSPEGSNVLELTMTQLAWIRFSIALPYLAVWLAGAYGVSKLAGYAGAIVASDDGKGLLWVSRGLFILLAGLIVPTLLGLIRSYWPELTSVQAPVQVFNNYMYTVVPLFGFGLIWWGTQKLSAVKPQMAAASRHLLPILTLGGLAAGLFVIGVYTNPDRHVVVSPNVDYPSYFMSDWAIGLTLILPAIVGWVLGLLATSALGRYRNSIAAPIYRQGLNLLVWGLYLIIVGSILINLLLSLGSSRLIGLGLALLLAVIYVWLIALVIGYLLLAAGAKRLHDVEEVVVDDERESV